ncbi:MAG: hypothetical protein JEZ00_11335 [Anaerolineaceae bacterium]|nr:hypothetical protein [Anaerolineaceae bacterium]
MDAKTLLQSINVACEDLARETDQVRISQTMQCYLEMISKFHHYSWHNQLLIWIQSPEASQVAGYQTWKQKFNRQVRRGENGIAILAPCFYKSKKGADTVGDSEETCDRQTSPAIKQTEETASRPVIHAFRVVHVFDVSQTEGDPLPECPQWRDFEKDHDLETALLLFAGSKGIEVEITDDLGGPEGVSSGGKIRLLRTTGTRTIVHELAHELFEHANPNIRVQMTTQQREIEADAVAYVIGRHYGLKADSAPNYLALWQAAGKDILACLERVRGIAVEIIQAVETHQTQGEAKEAT